MSNLPANTIQIPRPAPKTVSEIQVPPKAYLNFQFSLQGASSAKQGDDLVVEMPDGSKVICLGYYSNTAEGDRPQIAVNGEALPPSALDLSFFTHEVEGVRLDGSPEGKENGMLGQAGQRADQTAGQETGQEAGQEGAQADKQAGADAKAPASSGATATGEAATSATSASTASTASTSSSSGSSSGSVNDGGFKQDLNVDFLGGINRLPGLDLGSNRGFENTDIVGGPTGGIWGGIIGGNGTTTTPAPETPPFIPADPTPPAPPLPDFSGAAAGLKEEGADKSGVTTPGTNSATYTFSVVLPDGMDAADLRLNLTQPAPGGELAPGTSINTKYGEFSYTLTPKQGPVLDADGNPVLDADGNPVLRIEVEFTLTYDNLDNDNADINALPQGGTLDDPLSFNVTGKGQDGGSTTLGKGDVSFTIEGSNDGPVLGKAEGANLAAHMEVKEEGVWGGNKNTTEGDWEDYAPGTPSTDPAFSTHKNTTTIQLDVADADTGDSHTFTLTEDPAHPGVPVVGISGTHAGKTVSMTHNANGTYTLTIDGVACGTLSFSASGAMTFTLDSTSSVIQAMKAGDASNLTFNVTVTDKGGLSDSGDVTLTIHGTNDRPVFTSADSTFTVDITETGDNVNHAKVTGKLEGFDPEGDEVADKSLNFYIKDADGNTVGTVQGQHGTLVLKPDGSYTYTENGSLRAGENKPDSFTVIVKDKNGAYSETELTFNVEGVNNNVTFTGNNYVIKLVEEGVIFNTNTPNDVAPDGLQKIVLAEGNIAKTPDGKDFITDDDAPVTPGSTGGRTFTVIPKEHGTDASSDLVILSNTTVNGIQTIETTYGIFEFNTRTGDYKYTLKDCPEVDRLKDSEVIEEKFQVQVQKDGVNVGNPQDFAINIRGMNDMPVIKQAENLDVTAKGTSNTGTLTDSFTASATDVDAGDTLTYSLWNGKATVNTLEGKYGILIMEADGTYTYELFNDRTAVRKLGADETLSDEKFTIRVKDNYGSYVDKEITVTINGAYDKPVVTYARQTLFEDNKGDLQDYVDGVDIRTGTLGVTIKTTDTVHDGAKSYAVTKYNGRPVVEEAGSTPENTIIKGVYGTLYFNKLDGSYEYVLSDYGNKELQSTNKDALFKTENFVVTVTFPEKNGTSTVDAELNIDLKGMNDRPHFTTGSQWELGIDSTAPWDKANGVTGTVYAKDVDNADFQGSGSNSELYFGFRPPACEDDGTALEDVTYVQGMTTKYGYITIDMRTGEYQYTLDNMNPAIIALRNQATGLKDTFHVWVHDPHGAWEKHEITINIDPWTGTDGGQFPNYVRPTDDLVVEEDSERVLTGTDTGGTVIPGLADESPNASGPTPNATAVRYCFGVTSGGVAILSMQGAYGTVYIDALTGQYRYVLDNQLLAVQQLGLNDLHIKETFDVYKFTYGTGYKPELIPGGNDGQITVNIKGANDDPELMHTTKAAGMKIFAGATGLKTEGLFDHDDVDIRDTHTFSIAGTNDFGSGTSLTLKWGTVTIDPATGQYVFTYNHDASNPLVGSQKVSFWVFVSDGHGGVAKEEVTIDITAANAKPVIVSCIYKDISNSDVFSHAYQNKGKDDLDLGVDSSTGNITLDGKDLSQTTNDALKAGISETTAKVEGSFTSWDYEADVCNQTAGYKYYLCNADGSGYKNLDASSKYGTLTMSQDGTFTFKLNTTSTDVWKLKEGEVVSVKYYMVVRDANGLASGVQEFDIVITGTNNMPQISAGQSTISMYEDVASTAHYNLSLVDHDLNVDKDLGASTGSSPKGHNFLLDAVLKGSASTSDTALTAISSKIPDATGATGTLYSYTIKDTTGTLGVFKIHVDPNDATKIEYWFELDSSVAGRLGADDNFNLKFTLKFDDGQNVNSTSTGVDITITVQGKAPDSGTTTASVSYGDDAAHAAAEHDPVAAQGRMADAPAPLLAAAATELVSDQVGLLGSPDTTLPEGTMPASASLAGQGGSAGAGANAGATTGAGTGTESGPAQPITLETPLDPAPLPDMTSAPGQEALQFQLQTTGV